MDPDMIIDPFMITEEFSQIFGGLIGVYSRLSTKEKMRDTYLIDGARLANWQKRAQEMIMIKSGVEEKTMREILAFNNLYSVELIEMIDVEKMLYVCGDHL